MSSYLYRNAPPARRYDVRDAGHSFPLSEHFTLIEFQSSDGAPVVYVSGQLVALLERIRAHFGELVIVNSGYRTQAHNEAVGGVAGSQHTTGHAADIVVLGVDEERVYAVADALGVNEVGLYDGFVHVGVRGSTKDRWDDREHKEPVPDVSASDAAVSGSVDSGGRLAALVALGLLFVVALLRGKS